MLRDWRTPLQLWELDESLFFYTGSAILLPPFQSRRCVSTTSAPDGEAVLLLRLIVVLSNHRCSDDWHIHFLEFIVLLVLNVLQVINAEMLRRASGLNGSIHLNPTGGTSV